MQIKIFTIPILGGEDIIDEMNTFLRSKKILQMENQLINNNAGAYWCFCIKYLDEVTVGKRKKVDYREKLDEASFKRFSAMRQIRRQLSQEEGIPAYAIFTDEELANIAKIENLTVSKMKKVKGVGEKKIEKYSKHFIPKNRDEESQ